MKKVLQVRKDVKARRAIINYKVGILDLNQCHSGGNIE
jgi:hypothetical protein